MVATTECSRDRVLTAASLGSKGDPFAEEENVAGRGDHTAHGSRTKTRTLVF